MISSELLQTLLSPDRSQRQQAETLLHSIPVPQRVESLLQYLQQPQEPPHLQQLAAVLLRRDVWRLTDLQHLTALGQALLGVWSSTANTAVGDCLAEICALQSLIAPEESLVTMQCILQAVAPMTTQANALHLLIALAERAPKTFAQTALPILPDLLRPALTSASPRLLLQVVVAAAETTPNDSHTLLPLTQQCLVPLLVHSNSLELLEPLVQAADSVPALLWQTAEPVGAYCSHVLQHGSDEEILQAVHVMTRLAETTTTHAAAVLEPCCTALLSVLGRLDDNDPDSLQEWAVPTAFEVLDGDNDDIGYAQELLQDLLRVGGHAALANTVWARVQDWLCSQKGRAACWALQCAVQAWPVSLALDQAVHVALTCVTDNHHVQVQYDALVLLALLSETNAEQQVEWSTVLEAMVRATHSHCPKVAAMACLALVTFCAAQADAVVKHVGDVVAALTAGPLNNSNMVVQQTALQALASVAQASGEAFAPYYANVMPGLLAFCSGGNAELALTALETATWIGQAVKGPFVADGQRLLEWILPLQPDADPAIWSACARIASVLEEAYAPYQDQVMPILLDRATAQTDVELLDADENGLGITATNAKPQVEFDPDTGMESMTVSVPGRGMTKATINTTKIQEKALAARAIYEHAVALGPLFGPYIKPCLDAFLPLVSFPYSSEIRATSAQTLAAVFEAACEFGEETNSMEIPQTYLPLVAKAIAKQIQEEDSIDMESVYALADSLSDILCSVYVRLGDNGDALLAQLNLTDAEFIVQRCMASMVACLGRRAEITQKMAEATSDDEMNECQRLLDHEGELFTPLTDCVGYILKFFKQQFVPIFETQVAPILGTYLGAGPDVPARVAAVCLFDDVVEHCGTQAAAKFAEPLMGAAMEGMDPASNRGDEDLTRASIYGIAQIARYAPSTVLAPHIAAILHRLVSYASATKDEDTNLAILENAVSALASLVLFEGAPFRGSSYIKRDTALKLFLSALPLRQDPDEAKICHAGLCDLIANSWIPLVSEYELLLRVVGETLACVADGEDIATGGTCQRFAEILAQMQQQVPHECIQRSFSALQPEAQNAINTAFCSNANVVSP